MFGKTLRAVDGAATSVSYAAAGTRDQAERIADAADELVNLVRGFFLLACGLVILWAVTSD